MTYNLKCFSCQRSRVMAVDLKVQDKVLRAISIYLPHARYDFIYLQECYELISDLIREARSCKTGVILGGDFNTQYLKGSRGILMHSLCMEYDSVVANNMENVHTSYSFESSLGSKCIIDYVVVSQAMAIYESDATNQLDLGSDHRVIYCSLQLHKQRAYKKQKKKQKRWKSKLNKCENAVNYHIALDVALDENSIISLAQAEKNNFGMC